MSERYKLYGTVCIIHYSLVKPYSLTLLIEFKVLWSDGRNSWVKECNLPTKLRNALQRGKVFEHTPIEIFELGQKRVELKLKLQDGDHEHFKSSDNNYVHRYNISLLVCHYLLY